MSHSNARCRRSLQTQNNAISAVLKCDSSPRGFETEAAAAGRAHTDSSRWWSSSYTLSHFVEMLEAAERPLLLCRLRWRLWRQFANSNNLVSNCCWATATGASVNRRKQAILTWIALLLKIEPAQLRNPSALIDSDLPRQWKTFESKEIILRHFRVGISRLALLIHFATKLDQLGHGRVR
jgi:hypothetical protein